MFLGMQKNIIAYVGKTREEVENAPCRVFTNIVKTEEPVEYVCGDYYVGSNNILKAKQEHVRKYRNLLLEIDVDPVVSNPLRWNDMTEEDKNKYIEYRRYLLDYTKEANWWKKNPLSFEEYYKESGSEKQEESGNDLKEDLEKIYDFIHSEK